MPTSAENEVPVGWLVVGATNGWAVGLWVVVIARSAILGTL